MSVMPARGRAAAEQVAGRFVELDVTDHASVTRAVQQAQADSGGLDVLINDAGHTQSYE